jgi:hypothetical protein
MFKAKSKFKEILLSVILVFSLFFLPVLDAQAQMVTSDVQQAAKNIWDKVSSVTTKALKTSILSALLNVATITTQRLAYDAAMYLSAGGSGQQSLFEPRSLKEYGQLLGEQALGEFVGSLSESWSGLGLNICEPSPLQKLDFQKAFTVNVPVPKGAANVAPAPKCNWSSIQSSYQQLAQSVKDVKIDMSFDFKYVDGGAMSLSDALTGTQQGLADLSKQLTSLTEKLYGQGVDLSNLWTNPAYIKTLLNPALQITSDTSKNIAQDKLPDEIMKLINQGALKKQNVYSAIYLSLPLSELFPLTSIKSEIKNSMVEGVLRDPDLICVLPLSMGDCDANEDCRCYNETGKYICKVAVGVGSCAQEIYTLLSEEGLSTDQKLRLIYQKHHLPYDVIVSLESEFDDLFKKLVAASKPQILYNVLSEYNTSSQAYASVSADEAVELKNKIHYVRQFVFEALDKKIKDLEKSLNGDRKGDQNLISTLESPEGDLFFWKEFSKEYKAAKKNRDQEKIVFDKYFLNENNINKLLRQQLWDRILVMSLISEKELDEKLIKYVYYNDIDKYVKSSGDGLSNFVSYLQPGQNPGSVSTSLAGKLGETASEYSKKADELANNKGFKAVTDLVSGRVKTPADVVAEQFKQTSIRDVSATKQTSLMGAYFNADVGYALLNVAVSTFTNTVFNNLMNKVYTGLFKPDQMISNEGVMAGLTQSQIAKKLSANINVQMVNVDNTMTDYNVLDEFAVCLNEYKTTNGCVIDGKFLQALQGDRPMTIRQAVDDGFLNGDWYLLPQNNPMNNDKNCFEKAFCYQNLQKLRHARIISVGWELAANACEDPNNKDTCKVVQGGMLNKKPFTLNEALDNFYNCGQDANHPYSILCNLIDPNWLLKLPAQKCQTMAYGNDLVDKELADRQQICVDDVSCVSEDVNGNCNAWGYCTKEKNTWRLPEAQMCLPQSDSCRSFADSKGQSFSFLKNTLLLDSFNTCYSENVACAWYSKNRRLNDLTLEWDWQDNFNAQGEAEDRIYFTGQAQTCSADNEGCSLFVRAMPRLGTNLLPNSDFGNFVEQGANSYFESWKVNIFDKVEKHPNGALLTVSSSRNSGLNLYQPLNILAKNKSRYFIYSVNLLIPQTFIDDSGKFNWDKDWVLRVDAYKPGNNTPRSDYVYDVFGVRQTDVINSLQEFEFFEGETPMYEVKLFMRFGVVPDVDRLSVGIVLADESKPEGNQVIINTVQLEEVGDYDMVASDYQNYTSENLIYLKKAPDYYQCYQPWHSYNLNDCYDKGGYWNSLMEVCNAPSVCSKFTPYCSIDEVGCESYTNMRTAEVYDMITSAQDYCPVICAGYEKLYEEPGQFSTGRFVNLIAENALQCSADAVGCEEFTAILDDGSLENKYYFSYGRTCQLAGASDCQIFYTWDNPDRSDTSIQAYNLKAFDNQPVVTDVLADQESCNATIYNAGTNPNCYKFYALKGGESIDLNSLSEDNAYISYHLINKTVTCSNDCRPYRLTRRVTKDQCLAKGADINQFIAASPGDISGTCMVYAILDENNACSSTEVSCRAYRGSRSQAYFNLLNENFEGDVNNEIWQSGEKVQEAVQQNGYSWQNLNEAEVTVEVPVSVDEDNLYLLTFWARSASLSNDKLAVSLSGAEQSFTSDGAISIDSRWQQYVLGPVRGSYLVVYPKLVFSGMNRGNLFLDNVELREVRENYYLIADSWSGHEVCDQIPDSNIMVPGYMLGCDAYQDSYGYTHYLKSFTDQCRADAVGCELVLDTKNNLEGTNKTYNKQTQREIGELVMPIIETESACLADASKNYIWERGHCHYPFVTKPVNQKQCELWGYYWLGAANGKCVTDTIADDVLVPSDKLVTMVMNQSYLCDSAANGCSAYGKAVTDAEDRVMTCNLDSMCTNNLGCACKHEVTNDYLCTVPVGQFSCQMDTMYIINLPDKYDTNLCTANAKGCDKFVDSQNGTWYFRNPGNRVCEYKETRIEGQLRAGWFKKGTDEPCYPSYKPAFGLWGSEQSLDYYLAGIDDLQQYNNYVGLCSKADDLCTRFIDPSADLDGQRDYYYLNNSGIDTSSCNGQVNLAEGCILLNNTAQPRLTYSAEKTYLENFRSDYQSVAPQAGRDDSTLNTLTGYPHPYYQSSLQTAVAVGYAQVDLGNGVIQNYPYLIPASSLTESSSGSPLPREVNESLIQDVSDFNSSKIPGSVVQSSVVNGNVFLFENLFQNLKPVDLGTTDGTKAWSDYANLYQQVLAVMSQGDDTLINNTNVVVKVARDRSCAEWLSAGDQETVYSGSAKAVNTNFNLLSCQKTSSGECVKLAPMSPPQYLEARLYALRGFGWNTLDYSGYSVPYRYSLSDYKQIYLENEQRLALALDWKEQCDQDRDCEAPGAKCVQGRCYDVKGGNVKPDLTACRAYPEAQSPFIYRLANPILGNPQVNRCYPMTGYCANHFSSEVKDYNKKCYSDLECDPLERCVFDNKSLVDDCDCDYTKITYQQLGQSIYGDIDDEKLSSMGLCSGGINDGLPCFSDNECLGTQNRTMFRSQGSLKAFQGISANGTCVYPSSAEKKQGWKGFCLEKDTNQNCITWWPVNRLLGNEDIYYKDKTVGLDALNRYYCLHEETIYKRLLVGEYAGNNHDTAAICIPAVIDSEAREMEISTQTKIYATMLYAKLYYDTDIYYLKSWRTDVDSDTDDRVSSGWCSEESSTVERLGASLIDVASFTVLAGIPNAIYTLATGQSVGYAIADASFMTATNKRTAAVPFYPGAVVRVEGKTNFNRKWNTEAELNIRSGSGSDDVIVNGPAILEYIKNRWEGQSCFYMMLDVARQYPQLFCTTDKTTGAFVCDRNSPSRTTPIMVACSTSDYITTNNIALTPVPLSLSTAEMIDLIKTTYENYQNRCVVEWVTNQSRSVVFDLFNHVCEYQNIKASDYPLLFQGFYTFRGKPVWYPRENGGVVENHNKVIDMGNRRFSSANIGGTETVCDLMAEVRQEDGSHQAYTDMFGKENRKILAIEKGQDYSGFSGYTPYVTGLSPLALWESEGSCDENKDKPDEDCDKWGLPYGKCINWACYYDYRMAAYGSNVETASNLEKIKWGLSVEAELYKLLKPITPNTVVKKSVDFYTSPQPFGAIMSNNVYQPYLAGTEGISLVNQKNLLTRTVELWRYFTCGFVGNTNTSLTDCDRTTPSYMGRVSLKFKNNIATSSSGYIDNKIFQLFKTVYNLKVYGVNLSSQPGKTPMIFANRVISSYQSTAPKDLYLSTADGVSNLVSYLSADRLNKLCMVYKSAAGIFEGLNVDLTLYQGLADADPSSLTCLRNVNSTSINRPIVSIADNANGVYTIADNKQLSLSFYASADKNALPIRSLQITWGDNLNSDYQGFIENHQKVCDSDAYVNQDDPALQADMEAVAAKVTAFETAHASWFNPEKFGSCSPVCVNWPIGSTGNQIKGKICYDTDEMVLDELLPGDGLDLEMKKGIAFGNLYKQTLRCALSEGDLFDKELCIPVYHVINGKFVDSICYSDVLDDEFTRAPLIKEKMVFNMDLENVYRLSAQDRVQSINDMAASFMQGFNSVFPVEVAVAGDHLGTDWKPTNTLIDQDGTFWNPTSDKLVKFIRGFSNYFKSKNSSYIQYKQGAAGEAKNCVTQPFIFRHWYQNIVTKDKKCNFGTGITANGRVAGAADDVVYCRLTGNIEVRDNMGTRTGNSFRVYVSTSGVVGFERVMGEAILLGPAPSTSKDNYKVTYSTDEVVNQAITVRPTSENFDVIVGTKSLLSFAPQLQAVNFKLYKVGDYMQIAEAVEGVSVLDGRGGRAGGGQPYKYTVNVAGLDPNSTYRLMGDLRFTSSAVGYEPIEIVNNNVFLLTIKKTNR